MAAVETDMSGSSLGVDNKGERLTKISNGLFSPENTPGMEDGRVQFEKARLAAEAAAKAQNGESGGDTDRESDGDDDEEVDERSDATEEQNKAAKEVVKLKKSNYRGILGVENTYDSLEIEKEEILKAFKTLGTLIHPEHVKGKDIDKAYKYVLNAAEKLGVEREDINEVKFWDGEEDLFDAGHMEVTYNGIPYPTEPIKGIYSLATPLLSQLLDDPADTKVLVGLHALNQKITEQNKKDGIDPQQWNVDYAMFGHQFKAVKPYVDQLTNTPAGQPLDEEALKKVTDLNDGLKKLNTKHHFPEEWNVAVDKIIARHAAKDKLVADKLAADKLAADKLAGDKLAADKLAADKLSTKKFGNIEFPWATYLLPTGGRIIAGKKTISGSLFCVELPCTDPEKPIFRFQDDIDIIESEKYFATPGIKLMGETDDQGRPVKVWRKKDRADFRKFLFCVVGKGGRSDGRTKTKANCSETLCCFEVAQGIALATRSGFKDLVGAKPADAHIRRYCEDMEITAPWDVTATSFIISPEQKAILDKVQANATANLIAGYSAPLNSTSEGFQTTNTGGRSLDAILSKLESLEARMAKVDVLSEKMNKTTNTGGRSLDEIFSKLEALETRVARVDVLSDKMDKTTKILDALCAKVGLA